MKIGKNMLTVTFHPLVNKSIKQRPTMVTECWASIGVDFELVLASGILKSGKIDKSGTIAYLTNKN